MNVSLATPLRSRTRIDDDEFFSDSVVQFLRGEEDFEDYLFSQIPDRVLAILQQIALGAASARNLGPALPSSDALTAASYGN